MIGVTDHENVSASACSGSVSTVIVGGRGGDRWGPIRHRRPMSEEDRSRPVAVPVCREQQGAVGGVDGLDVFAVADVELVVAHEFGERHGVAAGDQPDRLHARTLGGDRNAESASGAADDHKVVDEVEVLLSHAKSVPGSRPPRRAARQQCWIVRDFVIPRRLLEGVEQLGEATMPPSPEVES